MRPFDLLIFDWDGTLMDSASRIADCLQAAGRDAGLTPPARDACVNVIGLGLVDALARLYPDLDAAETERLAHAYRRHYAGSEHAAQGLFPMVKPTLERLRLGGYLMAVATGKGRGGLDLALDQAGLRGFFQATRCADETLSKPHPRMLHELMEELRQPAHRTLMVGDTEYDLLMARCAGTAALAVGYGTHRVERLLRFNPLGCIERFGDIIRWLEERGQITR